MGFSDALSVLGGSQPASAAPPPAGQSEVSPNGVPRIMISPETGSGGSGFGRALDILSSTEPAPQKQETKPVGGWESFGRGVASGFTGNFYDELRGMSEAGGTKEKEPMSLGSILVGAAKRMMGDEAAQSQYEQTVQRERGLTQAATEQNPIASLAGNVAGAIALPVGGALSAPTLGGRMARGAALGAGYGAVYGAGEGTDVADRLNKSGAGVLFGAAGGAAAPAVMSGIGAASRGVAAGVGKVLGNPIQTMRAALNTEEEAARRIGNGIIADYTTGAPGMSGADLVAARSAGQPTAIIDIGGENTRALARSATNTSPAARAAIEDMVSDRFATQSDRASNFVRNLVSAPPHTVDSTPAFRVSNSIRGIAGRDSTEEALNTLAEQARLQNAPAYRAAYAAGDRPIWSPELERLSAAPAIRSAINSSISKWQNYAIRDGYGAMNPPFRVENGRLIRTGGNGIETHPDIQLWDYVARNLQDTSRAAPPGSERARLYNDLARLVKNELDAIVPEYQAAREGAARFFGQRSALEAGRSFVSNNMTIGEARLAIGRMQPAERQLFARGYAQQIIEKINSSGAERVDSLNFLSSPASKQKMRLALGDEASPLISAIDREHAIAGFGGATGYREAGANFVSGRVPISYARQHLNGMSESERALFAEGYVSDLADKVSKIADNRSVIIDKIFNSPDGRARTELALGKGRAAELEAFLRRENMMDLARKAMGNSTTARQLMEMGLAGGIGAAAGGATEAALNGKIPDLKTAMAAALVGGVAGFGRKVNFKVAQRVGEMLASDDPKVLMTAIKMAKTNPDMGRALRRAETMLEKMVGQNASAGSPLLPRIPIGRSEEQDQQ